MQEMQEARLTPLAQRPQWSRACRALCSPFSVLWGASAPLPFSVAVEGLALRACTLCSPFSRAPQVPLWYTKGHGYTDAFL